MNCLQMKWFIRVIKCINTERHLDIFFLMLAAFISPHRYFLDVVVVVVSMSLFHCLPVSISSGITIIIIIIISNERSVLFPVFFGWCGRERVQSLASL